MALPSSRDLGTRARVFTRLAGFVKKCSWVWAGQKLYAWQSGVCVFFGSIQVSERSEER
jgi:hypothetical protein